MKFKKKYFVLPILRVNSLNKFFLGASNSVIPGPDTKKTRQDDYTKKLLSD